MDTASSDDVHCHCHPQWVNGFVSLPNLTPYNPPSARASHSIAEMGSHVESARSDANYWHQYWANTNQQLVQLRGHALAMVGALATGRQGSLRAGCAGLVAVWH